MQQKQQKQLSLSKQRLDCSICDYRVDPNDETAFSTFPCSVRAFLGEKFKVWRCPDCQTIHCLDIVDLDRYYAEYPFFQADLTKPYRIVYGNLCRQLTKYGFSKNRSLLDYGCGANGLFVQYLQENGFNNAYGYDPYAPTDSFGNPATLDREQFDYISLQDVIEHVEDPDALLSKLNSLLSPGGYILIGTPNAANLDLNRPDLPEYYNGVHVPYHLHIYTREILESLGKSQGWKPVDFFHRTYHDTRHLGLNFRAWNAYTNLLDGSLDVLFEPIDLGKVLTSPKAIFYALFGYWLNHFDTQMSIMFQKSREVRMRDEG
jgi:SAM-dependent methyltransferase